MSKITIIRNHHILTDHAQKASRLFERLKGLLGKKYMDSNEALILSPCTCIHTFFMKFPIDVIFVNSSSNIIALYSDLKPNRMTSLHWQAQYAVEFPSGSIEKWNLKKGDELILKETYV